MKLTLDFSELVSVLGFSNTILSDKSVDDKLKNVIFMVSEKGCKAVGYNAFTFHRTELKSAEVEDISDEGWEFQVKASELNKIVSSFSSLYKTKVEKISFEKEGVKVRLTVYEEPIDEKDARLAQASKFNLEDAPILANINKEIHMEFPEELDILASEDLSFFLDALFPLMSNDSESKMAGKLNFAEDYIFVISSKMSAFFNNKLPEAFKNITLSYSSVTFLNKLCSASSDLEVVKINKYLCVRSGNTESFMKYQNVAINYKKYVEMRSKDNGIVVDRMYLKDVLKRMSNVSMNGKMYVLEDGNLEVTNEMFSQIIPLDNMKGEVKGIAFTVAVHLLEQVIIGKDEFLSGELYIYFVKSPRGYTIYLSDRSGVWFSNISVTRA